MSRLLIADRIKLIHGKIIWLILLVSLVLPIIQVGNSWLAVQNHETLLLSKDIVINGASAIFMIKKNAFTIFAILFIFISFFIGEEFQNGTIRNPLALGVSRGTYYLSKLVDLIVVSFICVLILTMIGYGVYSLLFGFGSFSTGPFNYGEYTFFNFLIQFLLLIANGSIYLMLAFLCKNTGITLIWTAAYTIGMGFLPGLFLKVKSLSFLTDWVSQTHLLYRDFSSPETLDHYLQMMIVSLMTIVLSSMIGIYVFKKADIK